MYLLVWRRHDRFGTFDNDLGFHSQYIWQIAHGRWFSTILGLPAFGHNATFGYLLLAPLSWLGGGPQLWNLIQTLALAAGALAIHRLASRRLGSSWLGAACGLVWLLQPVVQGNVWETFHPEAMAMTPLLLAYDAADRRAWRAFALWAGLAVIWKSDVALFLLMLGLLVAWRQQRAREKVRGGLGIAALAFVWFGVVVGVMIPRLSGGGTVFGPLYGDLGASPQQVVVNGLRHPTKIARHLGAAKPVRYGRDLLAPAAFVPVLGPAGLVLGLPQVAVSLLSDRDFTRDPLFNPHYQALPVTAIMLGAVEALTRLRRRRTQLVGPAIGAMVAMGLACSVAWGAIPVGVKRAQFWPSGIDPFRRAKLAAVDLVGPTAAVSATYLIVAHLSERRVVYSFPNPWRKVFYGVEETPRPDPFRVQFLLVDLTQLGDQRSLYDCLLATGNFRVLFGANQAGANQDGIQVAERKRTTTVSRAAELSCRDARP